MFGLLDLGFMEHIASGQIGFREFGKQASSESALSSLCGEGLQGFVATGV